MTPSASRLSTGTSLTAAVPSRTPSSASEGPGLAGHVTKATCAWGGAAPGPPATLFRLPQPARSKLQPVKQREGEIFFNPAFSLRTERCLEYLFSDFWFNSEAGFVSGTSRVTASFLPSREQALLCCACQGGDQSISCPFSLRTQIFLEAVLLLTEGSRSLHFYHLRSTGGHRSLRRGLRAPARLPQGSHWAWA